MKVPWQKERSTGGETAVQLRSGGRSTFGRLESYVPLLDAEGREIAAVLCADVSQVEVREGDNPLEFCLCGVDGGGRSVPLEYQDLLLFTPLNPEAGHPYGVSMLRSMPYLTGLLLKIYDAMGKNWDRCGNVRFAVTYKPQDGELDRGAAQERAEQIAALAHDLKTPLTVIQGNADLLAEDEALTPEQREQVEAILRGTEQTRTYLLKIRAQVQTPLKYKRP